MRQQTAALRHAAAVPTVAPAPTAEAVEFAPATRSAPPRVCVIAEIGVNHDGKLDRAIQLVEAAAKSGADAVKFQLFDPRHLLSNQARLAVYQEGKADDVFSMLDALKLAPDDLLAVRALTRRLKMGFIVTPFSVEDIETLARLDVDAVKIASPDAVNRPLLSAAASLGRPMIVSTGTADLDELEWVADLIGRRRACLMQCVSSYPTPAADAALGAIDVMSRRFGLPVGYSDHTTQVMTGALAVAAGACVIEKHFTHDVNAPGPDHSASFEPATFRDYVQLIRHAAAMHGPSYKSVRPVEADVRNVSRQSLCLTRDLPAGHMLTRADLTVKRPGTGVPAAEMDATIGKRLGRAVRANNLLQGDDLR
ncbi:MAG: N-acetylneuraminate synthase family protein [Planctomycetes bacterium]|nr:N-acetylneuraminate synthase family protein [Planctomycetota bacterium]